MSLFQQRVAGNKMIIVYHKLVHHQQDILKASIIISVAAIQTSVMSRLVLSVCLCILMQPVTVSWNIVDFRILYACILLANKM